MFDGRDVGVWDFEEGKVPSVKILLFEEVDKSGLTEIYLKAENIGKFLTDEEIQIKECDFMILLTRRIAGRFMSRLKNCYFCRMQGEGYE